MCASSPSTERCFGTSRSTRRRTTNRPASRLEDLACLRCPGTSVHDVVGPSQGCSQNPLATRFRRLFEEYPQLKEGSTHSRSEAPFRGLEGSPMLVVASENS